MRPARWIAVAVVVVVSCSSDDGPVARLASANAAAVVAAMDDASPYPPISRLGRWDGSSFVAVEAGSIDTADVVVVTHGWEPGLADVYARLQAEQTTLVPIWDPELVDADAESAMANIAPTIEALGRVEPSSTVLLFSWIDQSATVDDPFDARQGENATEINGHRLAVAVDQALSPDWVGRLHVLGHSFGANVATTGSLALRTPPRQLTLMDSPDDELTRLGGAANDLRYKLARLDIGRKPEQTFVDSYISAVGVRYGVLPGLDDVVDVQLRAPEGASLSASHVYPLRWYADALASPPAAGRTATGPWWSPLLGGDPMTVGAEYRSEDRDEPTLLTEIEPAPSAERVAEVASRVTPLELSGGVGGSTILLRADTSVADVAFSTTETSLLLEFDTVFEKPADGATLTIAIDDRARYTAVGPGAGIGAPGSFILLWDLEPGEHTLTAAITDSSAGAGAALSNLRVVDSFAISRNLNEAETTDLVVTVLVIAVLAVVAVFAAVALLGRRALRSRRAHR